MPETSIIPSQIPKRIIKLPKSGWRMTRKNSTADKRNEEIIPVTSPRRDFFLDIKLARKIIRDNLANSTG